MYESLVINRRKYEFIKNYKDDNILRNSYNELTKKTFGFNFENWYQSGYWGDKHIPYSLLIDGKIVASVSANIMEFLIEGKEKIYIQIGTVMTAEAYRGQGLSKVLMNKVIKEWENNCDGMYLYANDSVLDFYPRFGFRKRNEYQYEVSRDKKHNLITIRKLNMEDKKDRELVFSIVNNTVLFSKVQGKDNYSLLMFYLTSFMKDNVYYIKEYDAVIVCEYQDEVIYLQEVFSKKECNLNKIIDVMMIEKSKSVILGFTPINAKYYKKTLVTEEDTTLFVAMMKEDIFKGKDIRFPVLSHT